MEVKLASASEKQVWINKFITEYVRMSGFMAYMGASDNSVIQVRSQLENEAGRLINIPLMARLKGAGVVDNQVLQGNEDELANFDDQVRIGWLRNGVVVPKSSQFVTEIGLLDAAKSALKVWSGERLRDAIIATFGGIIIPGATTDLPDTWAPYFPITNIPGAPNSTPSVQVQATPAQLNTYLTNNADRVQFGAVKANTVVGSWSGSLANVTATSDRMTVALQQRLKRLAKNADPHIRPYKVEDGSEYFIHFMDSDTFRDVAADPAMINANTNARPREGNGMDKNPIFQDADLIYRGVISREVPELTQLRIKAAGSSGIDLSQSFLCGTQAVSVAWGQQPRPTTQVTDYGFRPGVGIEELRGHKKLSRGGIQAGVVTAITPAIDDN